MHERTGHIEEGVDWACAGDTGAGAGVTVVIFVLVVVLPGAVVFEVVVVFDAAVEFNVAVVLLVVVFAAWTTARLAARASVILKAI